MFSNAFFAAAALVVLQTSAPPKPVHLKTDDLLRASREANGMAHVPAPWHLLAHFDVDDAAHGYKNSGTVEEWYFGPRSYKIVYKSDKLNQTDVATSAGLFRSGDAAWPSAYDSMVLKLLLDPVGLRTQDAERSDIIDEMHGKGDAGLRCLSFRPKPDRDERVDMFQGMSVDSIPSVCFMGETTLLRYATRGSGQGVVNVTSVGSLGGRYIPRELQLSNNGKPALQIQVRAAGMLPAGTPPPEAPAGVQPLTGPVELPAESLHPVSGLREAIASFRNIVPAEGNYHLVVAVSVDASGQVTAARPLEGDKPMTEALAHAVRSVRFQPFLVMDQPVPVETTVEVDLAPNGEGGGRGRR